MMRNTVLLLIILYLGTGLRFYNLGKTDLWLDETSSVYYAGTLIPSIAEKLTNGQYENGQEIVQDWTASEPAHPPLYYLLLHFWMILGKEEITIRFLSVLAGIISLPMLYRLATTLFNKQVGLLSTLLLAVSPLHLEYSQEARMYSLVAFFVLVSTYFVIGFLKQEGWSWRIGYVLAAAANLYTQYIIIFALLFHNLVVLIFAWQRQDRRRLVNWMIMQLGVLLLFAPWTPFLLSQLLGSGDDSNSPNMFSYLKLPLWLFRVFSLGRDSWSLPLWINLVGLAGFFIFVLYGLIALNSGTTSIRRPFWRISPEISICIMYLLSAWLGAFVLFPLKPSFPRQALFGLPAFYILAARGINWISRENIAKFSVIITLTLLVLLSVITQFYQKDSREDWSALVNHILSEARAGDVITLHAFYISKAFNYYALERLPSDVELISVEYPLTNIPATAQKITRGHKRVWLVLSRMYAVDPDWTLKKHFDEHYKMLEEKHFRGIDGVFLYEVGD